MFSQFLTFEMIILMSVMILKSDDNKFQTPGREVSLSNGCPVKNYFSHDL